MRTQVWATMKTVIAYNAGYRAGEVAVETGTASVDESALIQILDGMYDSWRFDSVSRDEVFDAFYEGLKMALHHQEPLSMAQVAIQFD